jgi:K+-sensing histidine kinase KdpD
MKTKRSLLVVDDELDYLDIIKSILMIKGYEVVTALSAGEAVARAKGRFFNAAVLDISLPDRHGTELLSELLSIHPEMVAVMLTGHSSVQNAMQSLNRGAFAYLEKPLDPEHLLSVMEQGLEKQRLMLENRQLMRELEQRNRITGILLDVSQAVSQSLNQPQIIYAALGKVAESIKAEAGYVFLFEDGSLRLRGYRGISARAAAALEAEVEGSLISGVFFSREPVVTEDLTETGRPGWLALTEEGYQSQVSVPLTIVGESIGVMGVVACPGRSFTSRDIDLLVAIGKEISIAVRNAQLYEEASSAQALRDLDALRTELLANVSHELRTPLAVIKGSASSLLQPDVSFDERSWREFMQSIDKDADRLSRLVDDLLIMSRLESGTLDLRKERHDLAGLMSSVEDRLYNLASGHKLKMGIPDGLPRVMVDEVRIGEVLTNLVENAVKYSDDGTRIAISAELSDGKVVVSVADEGIGIPPGLHREIFNRFYQVDNGRRENRKGTGLGLPICRGIVEAHGGEIWVESQEGRGTRFSFSLPAN